MKILLKNLSKQQKSLNFKAFNKHNIQGIQGKKLTKILLNNKNWRKDFIIFELWYYSMSLFNFLQKAASHHHAGTWPREGLIFAL